MMKRASLLFSWSVLLLCSSCTNQAEKPRPKPPVPVKTVRAVQKDVPIQIKAIGASEAYASVAIKSQVGGQIAGIYFTEGSDVKQGDLLVSIDPEPFQAALSQHEATLARDQAQARFARDQLHRYEGLLKEGIVTRDQFDLLKSTHDSLVATLAADHAAIRNARIQLGYCSIRSPISGRTGAITLQPGNLVKANDLPIVTINQISPINVTFTIPEKRLTELKRAMAGNALKIETAVPGEPGGGEAGTVSFLDNAVNPATGTIKLKGVFPNRQRTLWPGQFTDVVLTLGTRKNAVVVPTAAIQAGQQGQFVYVVTAADNKAALRPVTSTEALGEETVVEKGVAAGETVVTDGQLRLTPGAVVSSGSGPTGTVSR